MGLRMDIAEALPRCFPLPRSIQVGSQAWSISTSAIHMGTGGLVRLIVLLSGPHGRFRRVRFVMHGETLLAGGYDAGRATRVIGAWLPNSDAEEMLEMWGDAANADRALHEPNPRPG